MTMTAQKPALLAVLSENADQRGWVGLEQEDLTRLTGIPQHETVHALWDLQKQGYLKFREQHVQGGSRLTRIRMTAEGRKAAGRPTFVLDEMAAEEPLEMLDVAGPSPVVDTPSPVPGGYWTLDNYPLIKALIGRRQKLEQAAILLEEAGMTDLAIAALDKAHEAGVYTPFEAEVVDLVAALGRLGLAQQ